MLFYACINQRVVCALMAYTHTKLRIDGNANAWNTQWREESSFARMHVLFGVRVRLWIGGGGCSGSGNLCSLVIMWICAAPFRIVLRILPFLQRASRATHILLWIRWTAPHCMRGLPLIRNSKFLRFCLFHFNEFLQQFHISWKTSDSRF